MLFPKLPVKLADVVQYFVIERIFVFTFPDKRCAAHSAEINDDKA